MLHHGHKMEKTDENTSEFLERQKILAPIHQRIINIFTNWIQLKIEQHGRLRVLDVGTGFGRTLKFLASFEEINEITTIDPSAEVLHEISAVLAQEYPLANISYRTAVAEELPFSTDSFEVAVAGQSLHHFKNPAKALHEIIRVVRAGGWLMLADWRKHATFFDKTHRDSFIEPGALEEILAEFHPSPTIIASVVEDDWYAFLIVKAFSS